jgi:hypothetical protein
MRKTIDRDKSNLCWKRKRESQSLRKEKKKLNRNQMRDRNSHKIIRQQMTRDKQDYI